MVTSSLALRAADQYANRVMGTTHRRQRKVAQHTFGTAETGAPLPIFRGRVTRVSIPQLPYVLETY